MRQVGGTHWGFSAEIGEPGGALPDPPRREVLEDTGLRVPAAELPEVLSPDRLSRVGGGDRSCSSTVLSQGVRQGE